MRIKTIVLAGLLFIILHTPTQAKTIYVDNDGPADFNNIQAAIDDANKGDIVLVANGTYTGEGNRDIDFKGKAITVKSKNGPEFCIINCNGTWDEQHRGFYFHSGEDANSILQGFTIINGCIYASGGGIYCFKSNPKIADCILTRNISSNNGGGICFYASKAIITNCIISNNLTSSSSGGGIFTDGSDIIKNCIISGNRTSFTGGGIVYNTNSKLINCTIYGNLASWSGGGIWVTGSGNEVAHISNCIIWGNISRQGSGNQIYTKTGGVTGFMTTKADYCSIQNEPNDIDIPLEFFKGNWISEYPHFANPGYWDSNGTLENLSDDFWVEGDYHLKSQAGRFDPNSQSWVLDDVTSPCIDAGDPNSPIGLEPFPNGGYINMGAYGGTSEASKSYFGKPVCETIVAGDINGDCKVDEIDLEILMLHWLEDNN